MWLSVRGKCTRRSPARRHCRFPEDPEQRQPRAARHAEFRGPTLRIHPFTSGRFHVLLNSLFKVLCNFPSRYLFAIGLAVIFSLRWSLPPALGCTLKQPDSKEKFTQHQHRPTTGLAPSRDRGLIQDGLGRSAIASGIRTLPNTTFPSKLSLGDSALGSSLFARRY